MTYLPDTIIAPPVGACLCAQPTNITLSTGLIIKHISATSWVGSLASSLTFNASGSITLPSGYYYYLESTVAGYYSASSATANAHINTQWYLSSSSTAIGSEGRTSRQIYQSADYKTTTADEKAIVLVDATSSAVEVELKVNSFFDFNSANSTSTQYQYAGYGRALIIQLDP